MLEKLKYMEWKILNMEQQLMRKLISTPQGDQLVDLTAEEIAQRQIEEQKAEQEKLAKEQAIQAKANAKASALAKLSALGLTEEEVKAIL